MTAVDDMKAYLRRRYTGIPAVQATTTQAGSVISPGSDLTATITHAVVVSAVLDALGDMEAAVTHGESAAGLLDGIGDMTASITHAVTVAAELTQDSADMQADITHEVAVAATLDGVGDMTAAVTDTQSVSAELDAVGDMTAAVTHGIVVDATLDDSEPTIPKTTGLTHHWMARSDSNTVVSTELTSLADLSGNDYHGTPLSGDNGGTIQAAGLNGRDYVSYNGTDQSNAYSLPSNMPTFTSSRTYFAVMRFPSGAESVGYCYGRNQADLAWAPQMMNLSPAKLELQISSADDYIADDGGFDEWQIWIITHDDDNDDTVAFRYNGSASGSYSGTDVFTSVITDAIVAIGANVAGGNQQIDFFEGGVYDHVLNGTEIGELESYLSALTGITIP